MDKKKHTTRSEVVRVEVKYVPSAKTGKELPISIELTSNSNYELPSSIKVNGTSVALTGDGYYYSKNVKVRPNEESLIEFTVNISGRLNKVTSFNIYIATANQGYGQPFPAKHQGQAFINNALVATNKFDSKAYNDVIQELEAPADKVEQVEVPYETVYKADPELLGGQRQVEKKGVSGQKTVITTHVLGANNQFVAKTSEEITKQPEAEIVRVGTKAETTTEAIPFVTVYEEDPTMKVTDKEVIAVAGVAGQKVTTKTYTLNEQTGELTTQETVKVTDPVNQVIKHGPSGEINYQTEYRENKNLTAGETKVIQAGKKGASTKVYDPVNGTATATFSPKTEASVTREPQLIVVLVENSGVVDMYLSTDVSKLAPLWDKMEDGDKLLWISALRIPEKFDDAKASYSVKGQDTAIKPLESIGTITADQIPARFNISDEDLKNAEIRLETDLFTENENSLINNKALVNLLNKAGSRVISIRNTGQNKQEFKKFGFAEKAFQKAKMPYKLDDQAGLLSVTPNLIPTIVYKPLTIAIADPSGELQITSAQLKVGSEVKDLKVAAGKVQDEYTPKDDTPIEVSYAFAGKATQTRAIEFNVTADGTSVAKLSTNVQPKAHFEVTTPTNEIIEVGTKPTSTSEEIPFETIYVTDEKMRADAPEVVLVEGKVGQKVTTINYTLDLNTGKVTAQPPQEVITAKPITHQIKRGVGKETSLPYTTIYQASEKLDLNKQEIKVKGKNGVLQPNGVVTRAAVTEIILVGTKPTVEEKTLDFTTLYTADPMSLPTDPEVIEQVGKAGKQVTTTKYKVDRKTGAVTALEPTVETTPAVDQIVKRGTGKTTIVAKPTKYVANVELANKTTREVVAGVVHPNGKVLTEVVARVIEVGTKPVVVETAIEPQVIYQDDPTMKKDDPEVIVVPGTAGKTIETTTFTVNEQTGEVSSSTAVETIKAIDHVIKRGSGEENQIPYQTRYEADETMANGTTAVKVAGQVGIKHPNGTTTKEPVTELILVGTKPVVVETAIEPQVIYQDDPTMKKDDPEVIVVPGTAGKTIETTTFAVNEQTGELSSSVATEMIKAIDRVIKRGSGEETQIPYQTRYKADATKTNGEKAVKVAGQVGIKHPNGTVTKEPVTELILVGTKPVVVETAIEPQVIYQDDPTMKKDDPEVIVVPGTAGKTIETTTFAVNEQTGELSSSVATETIAAIDRVIKRGSGEETQIPYQTRYKGDESLAKGERVVAIPGQVGIKHPNGTVTKEPVTEIILVGTKPEVVVEELDFTILCEADPTLPVGTTVIVQAGEKGQKIKTITYRVDEETGELIAEETEEVIAPVTQLVKQGTKVEEPQPEVKPVAKVETPKAQPKVELPQTGDVNENNLSLLGLLGLTGAGLLAVGRRKRQIK
ncbi:G5 domain-containing protein [Ligilactobacillus animalis]